MNIRFTINEMYLMSRLDKEVLVDFLLTKYVTSRKRMKENIPKWFKFVDYNDLEELR